MQTENQPSEVPAIAPADQAIALRIAGGDLLLSGHFGQWMPLMLSEGGEHPANDQTPVEPAADDQLSTAQVLFDVTSNRVPDARKKDELFSFTASKVESVSGQAYKLAGKLRAEGKSANVEAILRSPAAHTPFFVMVFRFDREKFPALWSALESRISGNPQGELRPTAWLVPPQLAAA